MFKLSRKYTDNWPIVEWDPFRYTPPSLNPINGANNQLLLDIRLGDSAISLTDIYLELGF